MPLGRGARMGLGIVGVVGLVLAAGLAVMMAPSGPTGAGPEGAQEGVTTTSSSPDEAGEAAGREGRASRLAVGDTEALAQAEALVAPDTGDEGAGTVPLVGMTDDELDAWLGDLAGLGAGFSRFGPVDRSKVVAMVGWALDRLAVEPAPERWPEALTPSAELLTVGLADASPAVRAVAAEVLGRCWSWQPGKTTWPDDDRRIASWKNRLHTPLVALLDDPEPGVRLAAVLALGKLPIDAMAEPAISRLHDDVAAVRIQVLNSFAPRPDVLTEDAILPMLYDPETAVALAAQIVLRARGLDEELIGLAKLLYHPRAELRASAVPLIEGRDDIDPVLWLLRLSRDEDESVRSKALEALGHRASPDARRRLAEMADSDPSLEIREAARRTLDGMTADLPPLPESSGVMIRAN
ncbi:HEAT repeat domain-containing protein [Tautonia sociabilis]|uniref:HEAT repeat domain-containing protein n=1 Tax=Tautonia sociabilis TaxID=2080755 RepID=A0A432MNP9_9BACT|nr:HEAT repeat domain-containing protein [Tautonia sociabilis]RUL88879.1 hypothetical protein TsocGM_04520 [Tautonia sociabilis]